MSNYKNYHKCPADVKIAGFKSLYKYFLYYAPGIPSSFSSDAVDDETSETIIDEFKNRSDINDRNFSTVTNIRSGAWNKLRLNDDEIDFENQRLKYSSKKNSNQLASLLRHIRSVMY